MSHVSTTVKGLFFICIELLIFTGEEWHKIFMNKQQLDMHLS